MADKSNKAPVMGENSLPDYIERFSPGETAYSQSSQVQAKKYGNRNELIPEKYQNELRSMVEDIQTRDLYARITEVRRAAKGVFYLRNIFDAYWSDNQDTWVVGGDTPGGRDGGDELNYPLNIYSSYERSFVKLIGYVPKIHFVATGPTSQSLLVAEACDEIHKDVMRANDMTSLAQDFARISWTDGFYAIYTRWVADGNLWGYYDEDSDGGEAEGIGGGSENPPTKQPRMPRGNVRHDIYGVPWVKRPMNAKRLSECPWFSLGDEIDITVAKATWPHIADKIASGEPGPGEFMFERTTRVALIQGIHIVSQMTEAEIDMPTMQVVWLRPSQFTKITDQECREFFLDNYPDGCKVVFIGNQYAESSNESMDSHWSVGWSIRAPGMQGIPYGYSEMVAQDMYNDVIDLEMETHMRAIPAIYADPDIFDFPAYSREKATPGMRFPLKRDVDPNVNIQNRVFQEPQVTVSAQLINLRDSIAGPISQTITGISQEAFGEADPKNMTLGGISLLMAASRGNSGTVWRGFVEAFCRSAVQAVKIAARFRMAEAEDGIIRLGRAGKPDAEIDLIELQMSDFWCEPDSDQSYPSTAEEEMLKLDKLEMSAQMGDENAKATLNDPANAELINRLRGIGGLKTSLGSVGAKVYQQIEEMLREEPILNQQAYIAAMLQGQEPNPYQVFMPSQKPSPIDKLDLELPFFVEWCYSPVGQRSKEKYPAGYMNVELYIIGLQQAVQQNADQQAMKAMAPQMMIEKMKKQPQERHPSESIQYKDLGPSGRMQLAAQAGIDVSADVADDVTHEQMNPQPPAPRKLVR